MVECTHCIIYHIEIDCFLCLLHFFDLMRVRLRAHYYYVLEPRCTRQRREKGAGTTEQLKLNRATYEYNNLDAI